MWSQWRTYSSTIFTSFSCEGKRWQQQVESGQCSYHNTVHHAHILQEFLKLNRNQLRAIICDYISALVDHMMNMFVESAISAYDVIKYDDRSSLKRETLNDYSI